MRRLPPVDKLVQLAAAGSNLRRWSLLVAARSALAAARAELTRSEKATFDLGNLAERVRREAERLESPFPERVLNATGVVLHTNLGRAPLAAGAAEEIARVAVGYSDLEIELRSGRRGSRLDRVAALLCSLSGAPAALVVNNAAAALMLAVDTLARGREVVLSRGELVEIGGSFRMPEIIAATRARLREVGTTNRSHLSDYERALGPETGLLLKVHRSNFSQDGFVSEVPLRELAALGRRSGVPVVEDRGSGTFTDLRPHGIPEREAWSGLEDGADVVVFSGDKLLGGPQAGIALGTEPLIARMRSNPLARALRVDKLTLSGLSWTLRALLDGREREIPVLRMLLSTREELEERAARIAAGLKRAGWTKLSVESGHSPVGGGSLPSLELPGAIVRIELGERPAGELADALRRGRPPVLVRVQRGAVVIDPRALADAEIPELIAAVGPPR